MVKASKEKLYQTTRERQANYSSNNKSSSGSLRKLPFNCCQLSLSPFEEPVCLLLSPKHLSSYPKLRQIFDKKPTDRNYGLIFDKNHLMEYLIEHGKHPLFQQEACTLDEMITLNMHREQQQKDDNKFYQDPILCKPFTDYSKVVAVINRTSNAANVYLYDTVSELNIKSNSFNDLCDGYVFNKKDDIIWLVDGEDIVLNELRGLVLVQRDAGIQESATPTQGTNKLSLNYRVSHDPNSNIRMSVTASRVMNELQKNKKVMGTSSKESSFASKSKALTSTVMSASATESDGLYLKMKSLCKKGYAAFSFVTSKQAMLGNLNIELNCDECPFATAKFLESVKQGSYIKSSVDKNKVGLYIQIKPIAIATSENFYTSSGQRLANLLQKSHFLDKKMQHKERGLVSYDLETKNVRILYDQNAHMDHKTTGSMYSKVIGQVVGGNEVLNKLENMSRKKQDEGGLFLSEVKLFVDPSDEATHIADRKKRTAEIGKPIIQHTDANDSNISGSSIVGKYLPVKLNTVENNEKESGVNYQQLRMPPPTTAPQKKKTKFGDFSSW